MDLTFPAITIIGAGINQYQNQNAMYKSSQKWLIKCVNSAFGPLSFLLNLRSLSAPNNAYTICKKEYVLFAAQK